MAKSSQDARLRRASNLDPGALSRSAPARVHFLSRLPDTVPPGEYLVHNNLRPARHIGTRGFKAWTQTDADNLEPCDCVWATKLGKHYVARSGALPPA
jgi:hypothetical protein